MIDFANCTGEISFKPYTWTMVSEEGQDAAWVVCPRCLHRFSLRDKRITASGVIPEITACPYKGCRWAEFIKLSGWASRSTLHGIVYLLAPSVECRCGWKYQLPDPRAWASAAAKDRLLDAHGEHRAAMEELGR